MGAHLAVHQGAVTVTALSPSLSLQSAHSLSASHDETQISTLPLDEFSIIEEQPDPLPKNPHGSSPAALAPDHGPANEG